MSNQENSALFYHTYSTGEKICIDIARVNSYCIEPNLSKDDSFELTVKFNDNSSAGYLGLNSESTIEFKEKYELFHESQKDIKAILENVVSKITIQMKEDILIQQQETVKELTKQISDCLSVEVESFTKRITKTADEILSSAIKMQSTINEENEKQLSTIKKMNEQYSKMIEDVNTFSNNIGSVVNTVNEFIPINDSEISKIEAKSDKLINQASES